MRVGLKKADLINIIGDYDGLAVRSATKADKDVIARGRETQGDRPRRHRGRQHRHSGGHRPRHRGHEHAVRQFDHDGRARHCPAVCRRTPDCGGGRRPRRRESGRRPASWASNCMPRRWDSSAAAISASLVAERALALKMKVIAYDPFLSPERAVKLGVEKVELDDLLSRADVISLHTPLTDKTKNILSAGCAREDQARRHHRERGARRTRGRGRAARGPGERARRGRRLRCVHHRAGQGERARSARRISSPRPISGRAPTRRRKTSRCRWPSRFPTSC